MKSSLMGIEISGSEIGMFQMQGDKAIFKVERLPENLIRDREIVSPETLSKLIKYIKQKENFVGKKCAIILPEFSTFFRNLSMPPMTESQLELNLPYEFRDFVSSNSIEYNYDYAVESIEKDPEGKVNSMELIACAGEKATISDFEQVLRRAGMRLTVAIPAEMAIIKLLRSVGDEEERCIIDIGYQTTRVFISKGSHLSAFRTIELGCRHIDEVIASIYNTDEFLAANYRESNFDNVLGSEALIEIYRHTALELLKVVNFYKYEYQDSVLSKVYFTGLGASVVDLVNEINNYVDFDIEDIHSILPKECRGIKDIYKSIMTVGAVL